MSDKIEKAPEERSRENCLYHSQQWQFIFQDALKVLKGKIIPKTIVKRSGYLVCDCKKKHTPLDEALNQVNHADIQTKVTQAFKKALLKSQNPKEEHEVTKLEEDVTVPIETTTSETEQSHEETLTNITNEEGHEYDLILNNKLLNFVLGTDTEKNILTTSQRRLLAITWLCLHGNMELLLPRSLHSDKSEEFRKINRKSFVKHRKLAKKPKYDIMEKVVIDQPSVSMTFKSDKQLVTVSEFVGKKGKNINEITKDTDCQVKVDKCGDRKIEITIHARHSTDRDRIIDRIHRNYRLIKYMKTEWQRKKEQHQLHMQQRRQQDNQPDKKQGVSCWDFYNEQKESARDEFEKKYSYRSSHKSDKNKKSSVDAEIYKTVPILERGSRCINCLINHEDKSLSTTSESSCRYHPGFVGTNGKWTCCKIKPNAKFIGNSGVDIQKLSHSYNGCSHGKHNWRPNKSRRCSGRDHDHQGHGLH